MSYPKYPEYKDSGVEWLGAVPAHWRVTALKRGYEVTLGKMLQPEARRESDAYLPYLRAANIQPQGVDLTDVREMWFSQAEQDTLLLSPGDLLVSEGGDIGRSALWTLDGTYYFQNSINRVRAAGGNSTTFLYYWMVAIKAKGYIEALSNKATIAHFTAEKVAAVPVPFPSLSEQKQIGVFLNHETAHIDALIAEQQRLIELLKEKRQAVISQAVTKGLDPSVPMKDSGVEWLGEVPEHWEVCKIAHSFGSIGSGTTPLSNETEWFDGGTIPWVTTGELRETTIWDTQRKVTPQALERYAALRIHPAGSLVIAMYGATIGRLGLLGVPATCNQACCVLAQPTKLNVHFTFYWLLAHREWIINYFAVGGGQKNINQDSIASLRVSAPTLSQQHEIVSELDREVRHIDLLVDECQRSMQLLVERRSAVISAAVTGKIDVRNWQSASRADAAESEELVAHG